MDSQLLPVLVNKPHLRASNLFVYALVPIADSLLS